MKKVCIIRHRRYPSDVRVRKEALALAAKGYEVDVICLGRPGDQKVEFDKGVNIYRLLLKRKRGGVLRYLADYLTFFTLVKIKLCRLHFKKRYDYIQVNTLPDFLVFVTLIPKLMGARVVLDLHEPAPELFGYLFGIENGFAQRVLKFIEQASIRYADHAITVTEELKRTYVERGALPSKISVILNVPNLEFNPDRFREYYEKKERNEFALICHGTIVKRYGQEYAIRAVEILKDRIPNIRLDILGVGEYEEELKKLVKRLKLEKYVFFHGWIPYEEMIAMLARADLGVVPVVRNAYSDLVHTNKMFELISMRKPVVITRTRAVEEFFGSDDSCLKYFESENVEDLARCIYELYLDPKKRETMVRNAYEKFEKVRWEIMKEEYCSLFV